QALPRPRDSGDDRFSRGAPVRFQPRGRVHQTVRHSALARGIGADVRQGGRVKGPARLLVVDDNAAFVDNLLEILTGAGYVAVGVGSCATAVKEAAKGFDIALVDMRLPDGVGTELATGLKQVNENAAIVMLTGFSTVEAAAAAVRAGAFAYLSKPCAVPELLL